MSRYTADSRDRVFDAVDMVALVETRVDLRRAGVNSYFGLCPFHDERTGSFHVRPDEKHYHCFGCAESGDPFKFVMETEGLDFKGALESLAGRFGVTLEVEEEDPEEAARRAGRERLYSLLERTATFYENYLWKSDEARPARGYLATRGLDEEMLREFRIGYAPNAWDRIVLGSRRAQYTDPELLAAGIAQHKRGSQTDLLDRFRGRIMFPTADGRGRVRGFGARTMGLDRGPKYLNTAEIEGGLYRKREVLYGIQLARSVAARAGRMVLAEGYTDVIALHQAGVRNAVGIMGTSLTREQLDELARLVRTLELCLDSDRAGQEAMVRAARLCADRGLQLRVVQLPQGADPGDLIATAGGAQELKQRVAASVPFVVFAVERILERADRSSAEGKDRALAELRPALAETPPSILRDELTERIALALELAPARVTTLLGEAVPRPSTAAHGRSAAASAPVLPVAPVPGSRRERDFLVGCLARPDDGETVLQEIDIHALFSDPEMQQAALHLRGRLQTPLEGLDESTMVAALLQRLYREAAARSGVEPRDIHRGAIVLQEAQIERRLAHLRLRGTGEEKAEIPGLMRELEALRERRKALAGQL